jgi:hypothetical protein
MQTAAIVRLPARSRCSGADAALYAAAPPAAAGRPASGLILQALADILHHQHIFALVFIVFHQPVGQQLRLAIVLMAGNGPGQRFGAQQRPRRRHSRSGVEPKNAAAR